jgi:Ca-activated chloride channel homolog
MVKQIGVLLMKFFRIALIFSLLLSSISPCIAGAFSAPVQEGEEEVIKIGSEVVLINVLVSDSKNRFVENLKKEEFELYEDGKKQELSFFAKQDEPISIGILIDGSTSMLDNGKLEEAKKAAHALFEKSNPKDEAFLMKFDDSISVLQEFTSDFQLLDKQLERVKPFGGTAIYDAVINALKYTKKNSSRIRQALFVVTDGLDLHSRKTLKDVLPLVQLTGIPCYFVGIYTAEEQRIFDISERVKLDSGEFVDNPKTSLQLLADETSGRAFFPLSEKELVPIALQIVNELRSAYSLGYYPPTTSLDGQYHKISVVPKSKQYTVRNRRGYISKL